MATAAARNLRAQEPYLMYDSIVIGPGAGSGDGNANVTGWFNNWTDFANASDTELKWFGIKRVNVPEWATNSNGEREDFSLYFYQMGFEILVPTGIAGLDENGVDTFVVPLMVPELLRKHLRLQLKVAGVDTTLKVPAAHAPAGSGPAGGGIDGLSGPAVSPANNGVPAVQNSWYFASVQPIARQGTWEIQGKLGQPALNWFKGLPGPGDKVLVIPNGSQEPTELRMPNWTVLRMWLRGYRNVQLRGARSSG